MLEVEGSITVGSENFIFFLPIYTGPYDIRVWVQKTDSSSLKAVEELFHVSVFENGRGVVVQELTDHRHDTLATLHQHCTGYNSELIFNKRSDVLDFLTVLNEVCHQEEDSDDDYYEISTRHVLTEAQASYWLLVNDHKHEDLCTTSSRR